ncbi:dihydroxy-acid dehydratase [Thermanaerosceptrum fracticalcis]|uniref:Dihydroxy-acid dehydratase n=1 Tax=Thermanaerosceptrum fracticalcis TaxID=1712410 RepID=A0A7G6E2S6_THEFR|nr:dihydroxy-acid dehydratase [Thermanaerosceptrum fracticalcis]QNB46380.1 dihydroxy-acid dehydratase [Thermanaerosceptrum fracticalcis]
MSPNRLQSFPSYQRAISKGHLCSTGINITQLDRPIIAIANSWNEIVPGHVHLRQVAERVKQGVLAAGGLPLEFNTIAICDGITQGHGGMRYPLPSRELIADSVEAMVSGHGIFDGMILIASCDKIVPAMLMAAARMNIPSIIVTGGPTLNCITPKESKKARKDFLAGTISEKELVEKTLSYYTGPGICPFLGTANTMCVVAEAMGMTLPDMALAPANSALSLNIAEASGRRIVELVKEDLKPRDILTREAFLNAITVVAALGGSLNSVLHLLALAREASIALELKDFDEISKKTPLLAAITPNSDERTVKDLYLAGGVGAVIKELLPLLQADVITVTGKSLAENTKNKRVLDRNVIRSLDNPLEPEGGIVVLYGTLAPEGAVVKVSAIDQQERVFKGPARVFDSEDAAMEAAFKGDIKEGDVVVVRYEGPQGGPGMRELHRLTEIVHQVPHVAIITDGRYSGASSGLSIGYVSPEAELDGPIAYVQDGDLVYINIPERRLDILVEGDLKKRAVRKPEKEIDQRSLLYYYAKSVGSTVQGAVREEIKE